MEVRPYADKLAGGDEDEKALRSGCSDEVIAHLLAIEVDLLGRGTDIRFPVDHEIDNARRLAGDRVGDAADINRAPLIGLR